MTAEPPHRPPALRVALIGYGACGRAVAAMLEAGRAGDVGMVAVLVRSWIVRPGLARPSGHVD